MNQKLACFNGNIIKWIAIITMVIDHTGAILFPQYEVLRYIGRIAFPLFAFLLVEGYLHTSNIKKYMVRLLIFALISEIPFDFALYSQPFYWGHQNIFWTLFLGLVVIAIIDKAPKRMNNGFILGFVAGVALMVVAHVCQMDYGAGGIILIFVLYYFRKKPWIAYILMAIIFLLGFGPPQVFGMIAILPMLLYNGERGKYSMKYFFYVFYPAHFLILQLIWMKLFAHMW